MKFRIVKLSLQFKIPLPWSAPCVEEPVYVSWSAPCVKDLPVHVSWSAPCVKDLPAHVSWSAPCVNDSPFYFCWSAPCDKDAPVHTHTHTHTHMEQVSSPHTRTHGASLLHTQQWGPLNCHSRGFSTCQAFSFLVPLIAPWDPILDPGGKSEVLKGLRNIQ